MEEENNKIQTETAVSQTEEQSKTKRFDEFLGQQKLLIEKLDVITEKFDSNKKKDFWDVLSSLSGVFTFLSSLVIAGLGVYFTDQYRRQDVRISQAQTLEKFIPYLTDKDENKKRSALLAVYALGDKQFTTRFAASFASDGNLDVIENILKEAPEGDSKDLLIDTLLWAYRDRAQNKLSEDNTSYKILISDYNKIFGLRPNEYIAEKWGEWNLADLYAERGDLHRRLGEYVKAENDFNTAREFDTNNSTALWFLGRLFRDKEDPENALKYFNQAIEVNSNCSGCLNDRARFYKSIGNFENAKLDFQKAIEIDPFSDYLYFNLGDLYKDQTDYVNAILTYEKVIDTINDKDSNRTAEMKIKRINPNYKKTQKEITYQKDSLK